MKIFIILTLVLNISFSSFSQTVVKLTKSGGIFTLPCQLNGKSTIFYFDPGASNVSMSINFYNQAVKDGILKSSDLLPEIINYTVANGVVAIGRHINIRELKIGNLILNNVLGTVVEGEGVPLLLGQSALEKFGSYKINNNSSTITIEGNYKSDIDLALKAAKQKSIGKVKAGQQSEANKVMQQHIERSKVDLLNDLKIAAGLEFEVYKIEFTEQNDGELTFKYDITNNSGMDYKLKALSQLYIFIDVFTDDGKVYSTSTPAVQMLTGNTVNGLNLSVKIRNKSAIYFRIYGVVNGPLLSTLEN